MWVDDIVALFRVKQCSGLAAKMAIKNQNATNIVSAYLGPTARAQVLRENIQHGDGQTIHSVILYSDLRASRALADRLPTAAYMCLLNRYLACAPGALLDVGVEVLNYIGGGVLAIFPIGDLSEEDGAGSLLASNQKTELRNAAAFARPTIAARRAISGAWPT